MVSRDKLHEKVAQIFGFKKKAKGIFEKEENGIFEVLCCNFLDNETLQAKLAWLTERKPFDIRMRHREGRAHFVHWLDGEVEEVISDGDCCIFEINEGLCRLIIRFDELEKKK